MHTARGNCVFHILSTFGVWDLTSIPQVVQPTVHALEIAVKEVSRERTILERSGLK